MSEPLLSRRNVMHVLGISKSTLIRMERSGKLPTVRLSAQLLRYKPEDVQRLMSSTQQ